jgi:predicted nucleic acid-binding protein
LSGPYLLDTSVISLLAPGRTEMTGEMLAWFERRTDRLFLSAVTVTEIQQGVCKLRRAGAVQRAQLYTDWLDAVIETFADRVLPFDTPAARLAGEISDRAVAAGRHPGFADVAIAATVLANGATLLTRNGRHFEPLGLAAFDPLDRLPD